MGLFGKVSRVRAGRGSRGATVEFASEAVVGISLGGDEFVRF